MSADRTTDWAGHSSTGFEAEGLCSNAELQRNYQLQLEDADLISDKDRVLFIDATKDASVASFTLERAAPKMDFSFTSHAISIPAIMATCQQCFRAPAGGSRSGDQRIRVRTGNGSDACGAANLDEATAYLSSGRASRSADQL